VTSTAALTAKAAAVRRDARVALLAGGAQVVGSGAVGFDPSPHWFDTNLRVAELAKYPPARSLLAVPGHRRIFPWYVARAVIRIEPSSVTPMPLDHRVSIAVLASDGSSAYCVKECCAWSATRALSSLIPRAPSHNSVSPGISADEPGGIAIGSPPGHYPVDAPSQTMPVHG
jgi:hypothetical protein